MTRRALFVAVVSVPDLPLCGRLAATWNRWEEGRRFERLCASGQARMGARLKAEGLNLDRMSDDDVETYVEQAINEYRQEQRENQAATHTENPFPFTPAKRAHLRGSQIAVLPIQ